MNINELQKVREYRELGLSQKKTAQKLGLTLFEVRKVWNLSEEEYFKLSLTKQLDLDRYREYILSLLKLTPQIKESNLYYRLCESFPEFECNRITFYRYMKKLRQETGYDAYKDKSRLRTMREKPQPGYEAQVDFGQYKLKDMYGINRRIYFFVMVLSYSNMRFAYFSAEPFTSLTAVQAHKYAFKYFGGRIQTIMYDQDRVFVVSENLGNIVFVKAFEEYVKQIGFSVVLCKPREPQSKGRVEQAVRFVKENFLAGRTYCGIDSLNSTCLEWLDKGGNSNVNVLTGKTARESFTEESKSLVKIPYRLNEDGLTVSVRETNSIRYKKNFYELPIGMFSKEDKLAVKETGGKLVVMMPEDGNPICEHIIPNGVGNIVKLEQSAYAESVAYNVITKRFADNGGVMGFIADMKRNQPRYYLKGCARLWKMTNYYTDSQLTEAAKYCLSVNKPNMAELTAYLIYRNGAEKAKNFLNQSLLFYYVKRATEIKEEADGYI